MFPTFVWQAFGHLVQKDCLVRRSCGFLYRVHRGLRLPDSHPVDCLPGIDRRRRRRFDDSGPDDCE